MQTSTRPPRLTRSSLLPPRPPRRKRISPSMFVGAIITLALVILAGGYFLTRPIQGSHAADDVVACTLKVPNDPLTAQGLATPYKLSATNDDGQCDEANADQAAFVQAAVIDPATGQLSVYDPLVVNKGQDPAVAPVVPQLPQNAIVGIWFGFNGDVLTLRGPGVQQGNCVNGLDGSPFGQVAFCNAPAFFKAANQAIQAGKLTVPALGTGKDGKPCPSVRDFTIVDQDQSDNVTTMYLVTKNGKLAQGTAANMAKLPDATPLTNGSDNLVVSKALAGALGCQSWMAPDLANPGHMATSQPLNELQAAAHQAAPVALVPAGDPMVLVDDKPNIDKLNAYRLGVNMAPVQSLNEADTTQYCKDLLDVAPQRIKLDAPFTMNSPTPDAAAANNLFTFLAQRFNTTWGADGGLNCQDLLKLQSPIKVTTNSDGVAVKAVVMDKAQPVEDQQNNKYNQGNQDNKNYQDNQGDNQQNKHHKHHNNQDNQDQQNNQDNNQGNNQDNQCQDQQNKGDQQCNTDQNNQDNQDNQGNNQNNQDQQASPTPQGQQNDQNNQDQQTGQNNQDQQASPTPQGQQNDQNQQASPTPQSQQNN